MGRRDRRRGRHACGQPLEVEVGPWEDGGREETYRVPGDGSQVFRCPGCLSVLLPRDVTIEARVDVRRPSNRERVLSAVLAAAGASAAMLLFAGVVVGLGRAIVWLATTPMARPVTRAEAAPPLPAQAPWAAPVSGGPPVAAAAAPTTVVVVTAPAPVLLAAPAERREPCPPEPPVWQSWAWQPPIRQEVVVIEEPALRWTPQLWAPSGWAPGAWAVPAAPARATLSGVSDQWARPEPPTWHSGPAPGGPPAWRARRVASGASSGAAAATGPGPWVVDLEVSPAARRYAATLRRDPPGPPGEDVGAVFENPTALRTWLLGQARERGLPRETVDAATARLRLRIEEALTRERTGSY